MANLYSTEEIQYKKLFTAIAVSILHLFSPQPFNKNVIRIYPMSIELYSAVTIIFYTLIINWQPIKMSQLNWFMKSISCHKNFNQPSKFLFKNSITICCCTWKNLKIRLHMEIVSQIFVYLKDVFNKSFEIWHKKHVSHERKIQ